MPLEEARQILESAPDTPEMQEERQALAEIGEYLASGAGMKFLKHAKYQSYQATTGRPRGTMPNR